MIKYLKDNYLKIINNVNKGIPSVDEFYNLFKKFEIKDDDFNYSKGIFPRGDGGMSKFYKYLSGQISYEELKSNN